MEVVKPERFFHERFGLSDRALERVLGTALERRADWADLYFEFRVNQTASLEEGVVKKATRNVSQGVGVRVVAGARSGYAHSDEVSLERLELAARAARAITDEHGAATALPARHAPPPRTTSTRSPGRPSTRPPRTRWRSSSASTRRRAPSTPASPTCSPASASSTASSSWSPLRARWWATCGHWCT